MQLINLSIYPDRNDENCITTVLHKTSAIAPTPPAQTRAQTKSFLDAQALIYERLASQDRIKVNAADETCSDPTTPSKTTSVVVSSGLRQNAKAPVPTIYSRILLNSGFRERDLLNERDPPQKARIVPKSHGSAAKDFVEAYLDAGRGILFPDNVRRAEAGLKTAPSTPAASAKISFKHGKASKIFGASGSISWASVDEEDDGKWYKTRRTSHVRERPIQAVKAYLGRRLSKNSAATPRCYSFLARNGLKNPVFAPLRASAIAMRTYARAGVAPRSNRADRVAHPTVFDERIISLLQYVQNADAIVTKIGFRELDEKLARYETTLEVEDALRARIAAVQAMRFDKPELALGDLIFYSPPEPGMVSWDTIDGLRPELCYEAGLPNGGRLGERLLPDPPFHQEGFQMFFRCVGPSVLHTCDA